MRRLIATIGISLACATGALAGGQIQTSGFGAAVSSFVLCSSTCAAIDINAAANAAVYVYVFDATTLPGNGTLPASTKLAFPVALGGEITYAWPPGEPGIFLNGVVVGCSSAVPPTFTATTACFFSGRAN